MAIESITKSLSSGSGIDTGALAAALIEAQFAGKTAALTARSNALTAQISGVAKLRSAITGFDSALTSLIAGGTLASKLTSSNDAAVKATAVAGADLSKLSASISVAQLASAQVSTTDTAVPRSSGWGTGTLTLQLGRDTVGANGAATGFAAAGSPFTIDITEADATLDGIAARINAAAAGITASVIADGDGARLVLRGASGGAQAFELSASDNGDGANSLAALAVGANATGTTTGTRARDAVVQVDGVRYVRPTNTVSGVVAGVVLDLRAVTTTPAALSMTRPTTAVSNAVSDFVATYNEMLAVVKEASDPVSGPLRGDPAVATMARQLRALTTTPVVAGTAAGAPRTLADLGIATQRDGTLTVDAKRLQRALETDPDAVEAMFAAGGGLGAAMSKIATQATDKTLGLDAATTRYTREIARVAEAQDKLAETSDAARTRITRQFATMDARVAAYKATQTFLTGQIAAWNKSDS